MGGVHHYLVSFVHVFNEIRVLMRLDWFVFQEPIFARD